jgi:hypothetical protein
MYKLLFIGRIITIVSNNYKSSKAGKLKEKLWKIKSKILLIKSFFTLATGGFIFLFLIDIEFIILIVKYDPNPN